MRARLRPERTTPRAGDAVWAGAAPIPAGSSQSSRWLLHSAGRGARRPRDHSRIDGACAVPGLVRGARVRPGGQNVNKVSSKVVLRFDFEACSVLALDARERLRNLAKNRLDAEGWITIAAQTERDQPRNLEHALARLSELIRAALVRPRKRRLTRPTNASRKRRLNDKRHVADKKANRRSND